MQVPTEFRLLVIADAHCATSAEEAARSPSERQCRMGLEFVARAIDDARARGGFDAVALMGDLLNDGACPQSEDTLAAAAALLRESLAETPLLVVPGNHDGDPARLSSAFGTTAGPRRVGPYRFYVFADRYGLGDVCTRPDTDRQAFVEWAKTSGDGPIIVLQHNPMNPAIVCDYPFMLTNRDAVMADYSQAGVLLSLSGHYHAGQERSTAGGVRYFTAPVLCEEPFRYTIVTLRGREMGVLPRQLQAPDTLPLVDRHAHTEFAYCGKNVSAAKAIERARLFGLSGICLVEHAPQIYCTADDFWTGRHVRRPELWRSKADSRAAAFRAAMEPLRNDFVRVGLEVELDADGKLTLHEDERWIDLRVGAIHWLKEDAAALTDAELASAFMRTNEGMLAEGIDVLAHPFRVFAWAKRPEPPELYVPLAEALAAAGVAAEINCHLNNPVPAFFAECIARGVKITFGSDAHLPSEVGAFGKHLDILQQAAGTTDPEVLRKCLL